MTSCTKQVLQSLNFPGQAIELNDKLYQASSTESKLHRAGHWIEWQVVPSKFYKV